MKRLFSLSLLSLLFISANSPGELSGVQSSSLVAKGESFKKLADGFRFTEGPVSDKLGNIYFTDIPNNRIHLWSLEKQLSVFLEESGGANGLAFDVKGNLLACQGSGRSLVSIDMDGSKKVLADSYMGENLNSPNDLWIDPQGGIYFTDPRYGKRENMEQDGEHVYYLSPERNKLIRVINHLVRPNGIVGTPDGKILYVADHGANKTFKYEINPDGSLSNKQLFASMGSDGLALDELGNLYLTGDAVQIYTSDGKFVEQIELPERPSNLCFGGADGKTLFITARTSIYSVKMTVGPASSPRGSWTMLDCTGEPDGRHETTFVECKDYFYLIGGRESQRIDRFDPLTSTWTKMEAVSPLIHHFQPVLWKDKIYMLGAMTGHYPEEPPMSHIQIYDPEKDLWTQGGEIPEKRQRGGAGTVVYKEKIYMACGITLGHTSGTNSWFDEYDPSTDSWNTLPDAPHKRDHFHAVVLGDKMYCMGGRNSSYHEPDNFGAFFGALVEEIDCYDFISGTWETLEARLPVGSAAAGVAVLDGKILYFGGETATKGPALNRTWAFDPATELWTELAPMNQGRHGSQAVVYKNKVYIAAGSPVRGGGRTQSIEVFSY